METSQSRRKPIRQSGFTLIETLAAVFVLIVGLVGVSSLMGTMMNTGARSRYISEAATLASEKMENLERYPAADPNVAVTSGSTAGSLTADTSASVTSNGITENVDYYDTIQLTSGSGSVSETVSNGSGSFTTISHTPNGQVTSTTGTSAPTPTPDSLTFDRRWLIEANTPVSGVRRITVLVRVVNPAVMNSVTFQMSAVRP